MSIRIITDSSADLEPQELVDKGIICVPLSVTIGDMNYLDGPEISKEQFYEELRKPGVFPKTSQPSPDAFLTEFLKAKEAGDTVIAILLASGLSGTVQSASIAKELSDYDDIYIVDSVTVVTGLRMLLDIAVGMRAQGASAADIVTAVEGLRGRVRIYAVLDTLEYLHRGGRLSKTVAMIGDMANLKPIIFIDNELGAVTLAEVCIGRGRATKRLISIFERDGHDPDYPVYFPYSDTPDNVYHLLELAAPRHPYLKREHCYNLGPTIATHIGLGAFGFTYIVKDQTGGTSSC